MNTSTQTGRNLSAWFDQAVKVVRNEADYLEKHVFVPLWRKYFAFAVVNPATTVLLSVFVFLGLLPVMSFLAFAVLAASTFTFMALVSAAVATTWVLTIAAGMLFVTLGFIFAFSLFVASNAFGALLLYRFYVHVTGPGGIRDGVSKWWQETWARLSFPRRAPVSVYADSYGSVNPAKMAAYY